MYVVHRNELSMWLFGSLIGRGRGSFIDTYSRIYVFMPSPARCKYICIYGISVRECRDLLHTRSIFVASGLAAPLPLWEQLRWHCVIHSVKAAAPSVWRPVYTQCRIAEPVIRHCVYRVLLVRGSDVEWPPCVDSMMIVGWLVRLFPVEPIGQLTETNKPATHYLE